MCVQALGFPSRVRIYYVHGGAILEGKVMTVVGMEWGMKNSIISVDSQGDN